jgi:riboflavin synthase
MALLPHLVALHGTMFTGITQQVGRVVAARGDGQARVLRVDAGPLGRHIGVGDSVCVDGVCLTATDVDGSHVEFDVSAETLRLTTLGGLGPGGAVNLEPALQVGDRLGGHFVSGHADGTGVIRRMARLPGEVRLEVEAAERLTDLMILKGSVAVDGISLTVAALRSGAFEVSLIPHTLAATTLQHKGAGDRVNIECDMIGRWVRKLLGGQEAAPSGPSIGELEEQGF